MSSTPSLGPVESMQELPRPNLPLLRKVLDHIDAHPEEWNQAQFAPQVGDCKTTYCVAGHAVAMTQGVIPATVVIAGCYAVAPADRSGDWEQAGREALGLTRPEASAMFYGSMTPGDYGVGTCREAVQVIAERIAARAGERL